MRWGRIGAAHPGCPEVGFMEIGSGLRRSRFTVLMCPQAVRVVLGLEKSLELYKRTQS